MPNERDRLRICRAVLETSIRPVAALAKTTNETRKFQKSLKSALPARFNAPGERAVDAWQTNLDSLEKMTRPEGKKQPTHLGFLTAMGDPTRGVVGGFLVLNLVGRPTEFHCTAPVRPNRAQEILYGATLEGFLCGEQIARALVGRSKTEFAAILTNNPNMLTAGNSLNAPLAMVFRRSSETVEPADEEKYAVCDKKTDKNGAAANGRSVEDENWTLGETADEGTPRRPFFYDSFERTPPTPGVDYSLWRTIAKGRNRLALPTDFADSNGRAVSFEEISARLDLFFKSIDSVEPFERIRLAVEEAQKSG